MSRTRHTTALVAALGTAASLVAAVPVAQAADGRHITDYGLQGRAFGSVAKAESLGVGSSASAPARIGCTRMTGVESRNAITEAGGETGSVFRVSGVDNTTRTYRTKRRIGSRSVSTVAEAVLGDLAGPHIILDRLRTRADAFARRASGKLGTRSASSSAGITGRTGTALDDLLGGGDASLKDLLDAISAEGGSLEIPGLGVLRTGSSRHRTNVHFARAGTTALRGTLYGQDGQSGGEDDVRIVLGRAESTVRRDLPAGVFRGRAVPLEGSLVGDLVSVGRVNDRPLPCPGTDGDVRKSAIAGVDLGNAAVVDVGALRTRVFGVQRQRGSARGWTESRVSDVDLGGGAIELRGIVGRVNVQTDRRGRMTARNIKGSTVGAVIINGEELAAPEPGDVVTVDDVARLEFFVADKSRRGASVTAVRVTLLGGTAAGSVLELGQARAAIDRY